VYTLTKSFDNGLIILQESESKSHSGSASDREERQRLYQYGPIDLLNEESE
jgi:hypothetical protein